MKTISDLIRPTWIAMFISGLVFFSLLSVRLDLFRAPPPVVQPDITVKDEKNTWMNIYQKGKKIGYSHRRIIPLAEGYNLFETTHMQINTMGMVQDIHLRTTGSLQSDFSIASFSFDIQSSLFHFRIYGRREGEILRIFSGEQEIQIPVEESLFLTPGVMDAALDSIAEPGQTQTFMVFDPSSMGRRPVHITLEGYETIEVMDKRHIAKKVSINFLGVSQTAWIGEDGHTLQEKGMLGIRLQRTTQQKALDTESISSSSNLTDMVSVTSNKMLDNPSSLKQLTMKVTGVPPHIDLNGERQRFENGVLTIVKEVFPDMSETNIPVDDIYLKSSPFIQSDHADVLKLVSKITSPEDSPVKATEKILKWIDTNIEKRPVLSVPNALETLRNRMGDCNEHAVLLAAMTRAYGIPSQVETGLVYSDGRFYYHAWNSLYLKGQWITADATTGELPADVTHIRIIRGSPERQIDLIGIIGKVDIEILEISK